MSKDRDRVTVRVEYVGQEPFSDEVPSGKGLQAIKVDAMKKFGLSPGDSAKYVLKYNGAVVEDRNIGDFGEDTVVLTLSLKEEVNKG